MDYLHRIWRSGISNKFYFESDGTNGSEHLIGTKIYVVGNWYHFAAVRDGTTIKTYLNGILEQKAATFTASAESSNVIQVGGGSGQTHEHYMQTTIRIYKGVAKYTSDFMPPSINPDILPDTPSGVSGGSKLNKIIDGAVHFDGN